MADPRATVTIGTGGGAVTLVADIEAYAPFGEDALGVTVFDGVEDVTIQDFGWRSFRQEGSLESGGGESPGLIATATVAALHALVAAPGVAQALADSLGNAGTVKFTRWTHPFAYAVPGPQVALHRYTLAWRWCTLTTFYGAAYTGR
jgi:hypothetical protein